MRFRRCHDGFVCDFQRELDEMMAPVMFQVVRPPDTFKKRVPGKDVFHDEDCLSTELDAAADAERMANGNPCAIIYEKHLNGKCPGEMGGVSEAEADTYVKMGYARPATDEDITAWFAQGCVDDPAPELAEVDE